MLYESKFIQYFFLQFVNKQKLLAIFYGKQELKLLMLLLINF